ncbi:MAG: hypothetical protein GWN58_28295 [Anaerolineae bacterium]|nr:hypothetical protein [Anaerolineae bacterium]
MKLVIYTCCTDCGDGSNYIRIYPTMEDAMEQAQRDIDAHGVGMPEDQVARHEIDLSNPRFVRLA